jgi:hypothetical protein
MSPTSILTGIVAAHPLLALQSPPTGRALWSRERRLCPYLRSGSDERDDMGLRRLDRLI